MTNEKFEQEILQPGHLDIDDLYDIGSLDAPSDNPLQPQFQNHQEQALSEFLKIAGRKVTPKKFYRDVFPKGALADASLQEKDKFACRIFRNGEWSQYVNDDLTEIMKCTSEQPAEMNCIAYAGRGESPKDARELYAMIFHILLPEEIKSWYVKTCLERMEFVPDRFGVLCPRTPRMCPTYILTDNNFSSVYFCYVLKDPIPMFYRLHNKLQRLYDALSRAIHKLWDIGYWNDLQQRFIYTYECKKPMPDGIFQRYPVVGSKSGNGEFVAYKVGDKYDLDELNILVPKVSRVELYNPQMSLEEAKEKHPDWYERRIVKRKKASKLPGYFVNEGMYTWFWEKVNANIAIVELGAMEALASYAVKAQIPKTRLLNNLNELQASLSARFADKDILEHKNRAMEFFEEMPHHLIRWGIKGIEKWSGLTIERGEKIKRTQKEHLARLHKKQAEHSCQDKVIEWFKKHPSGTQKDCSIDLDISRKTVSKWWPIRKKRKQKPRSKKTPKTVNGNNLCPNCGAEMVKTKKKPYFWEKKASFYTRIDKDCPNCHHHVQGKSYPCQRPT